MNEIQAEENPLSQDFNIKSLLKFALPTIIMMLLMGLYTIVDTIFVARFVGTNALSALNIVCPVINLIVGLGTMLATGGSAIVARKMGAGESVRASRDFTLIVGAGVILGVIITVFGVAFIDRIIWGLGASRILFPYCREYLFILLLFTPASMMQVLFQNLIVTAGRPGIGMALGVSAGAANILFDYIFMVLLQMGIKGAALGTGIGYLIPTLAGILFFTVGNGSLHFRKPVMDISILTGSCMNGFSEMVSQAASAVTTFLFNRIMMKLLGEDGVAAITIIIYTQFLLTTLYIGFSMGVAPVLSYNYGKQDCVVKWEAVSSIIIPAYVWADTCTVAHPAGIYRSDGCMAGSADSGATYNGCGGGFSLSEQRQVSLRLIICLRCRHSIIGMLRLVNLCELPYNRAIMEMRFLNLENKIWGESVRFEIYVDRFERRSL